ncbi:UNVERIFIED_CONTAM: putative late blight resistance proteinR1A-3 [Sesamum calycinum]|uniref:Late blight resistance proteinR1A-3 n=1 Tax=Sesamum calycinum TaxID=2727403 RepID=A0AAW2JI22_9LAMI
MAYNLESLVQILHQILHPDHHHPLYVLDSDKKEQIENLLQKARFLKDFSENSSSAVTSTVHGKQSLESRIRDAAYDAEDVLESHLVGQIRACRGGESFIFSPPDLEKVIGELDSAKEEMMTIMDYNQKADTSSPAVSSSRQDPNPKNIIVGVGEDLIQLKDQLVGQPSKALQVIPIVGMESNIDEMLSKTDDELSLCLHQALKSRRYLIVLDDVWDVKPWDDTRRFFPDDNNGSQIIVTTRESSVADYTGSGSSHHQMNLLKDDDSWNLLRQKAETNQDFWEQVSDNVSSTVADKDEHFSKYIIFELQSFA